MNNTDPLHGITLKRILEELHTKIGWQGLYASVKVNCFHSNPTMNSSLNFLRKTEWARVKVENLYKELILKID